MDWRLPVGAIGICVFLFVLGAAVITGGVMLLDSDSGDSLPEDMDWAETDSSDTSGDEGDGGFKEYPDSYFEDVDGEDVKVNENPLPPKDESSAGSSDAGGETTTESSTETETQTPTETETETPSEPEEESTTETEEESTTETDSTSSETTNDEESTETGTSTPEEEDDGSDSTESEDDSTETETPSEPEEEEEDVNKDSDGDGIPDRVSGNYDEYGVLADSDPDRMDVFIEVDYMEGTEIPKGELAEMKEAFANAPVDNPDGSEGITVHFIYPDEAVSSEDVTTIESYHNNQHQTEFDYEEMGVRHVLIVNDAAREEQNGGIIGGTQVGSDGIIAEHSEQEEQVVATIMHEMGHSFGLLPRYFDGIDSDAYSVDEYPSVMNYNYPGCYECDGEKYAYSSGEPFDDWSVVEEDVSWFLETSELEK